MNVKNYSILLKPQNENYEKQPCLTTLLKEILLLSMGRRDRPDGRSKRCAV